MKQLKDVKTALTSREESEGAAQCKHAETSRLKSCEQEMRVVCDTHTHPYQVIANPLTQQFSSARGVGKAVAEPAVSITRRTAVPTAISPGSTYTY